MQKLLKIALALIIATTIAFCLPSGKIDKSIGIGWPEITNQTKPWARWWWQGSSVDSFNLSRNMEEYSRAGLGGLELTAIYGVKGLENKFIPYTSTEWMNMFSFTLTEAKRLDLGIDMALASGWPFGGSWVTPQDACKYLQLKSYKLTEGELLAEKIEYIEKPIAKAVGKRANIKNLSDPIASNDSLQIYAFDQVRFPRKLPLVALMAYSEKGEIINITDKVKPDGSLNWIGQKGNWILIAAFAGWHGKMVERASPGGEGDVIDHFSAKVTKDYLAHFDKSFENHDLSGLRAFFNDSYEVDDATGEANWTPEFFEKFKVKRGYDLREYLPLLMGEDNEMKRRLMCDFRETISDLLLEEFTIPWSNWAATKGKIIRNQSHGSPANILDLYAASNIPETEGTNILNIKFASSAAHISGKKLVGAEACTWLNEHFISNLADAKENVDRYLVGGVNHIVYHGTPYSPESDPWPGRMFYASEHFAPTNPLWKDFSALNSYVTRVQSFLQRGIVKNDILLYFPIYDQWMEPGKSNLQHFHGAEVNSEVYILADQLQKRGYTFDFISDRQISELTVSGKDIKASSGFIYKTLLIPSTKHIPLETLKKIIELANQGITVIFDKNLPENTPGFGDYSNRQKLVKEQINTLHFHQVNTQIQEASIGKGKTLLGQDVENLLGQAGIYREALVDSNLEFVRLEDGPTETYFVTNWSDKNINNWVAFNTNKLGAVIYNPMNGEFGAAKTNEGSNGTQQVFLQIKKGESCIIQFWPKPVELKSYGYWQPQDKSINLVENWNLEFISGGPVIPQKIINAPLKSWTELSDENTKFFSGTAVYSINFSKPTFTADKWELNLGEVYESASVKLNGKSLGTLIGPNYSLVFDAHELKDNNLLEITVSNLMANRIIYMDQNGLEYRKFYNVNFAARLKENQGADGKFTAVNWAPKISGLIGPVSLIPQNKLFND